MKTIKKKKTIKVWHITHDSNNAIPEEGCKLIPMEGYRQFKDYYLCVPQKGLHARSANCSRYGQWKKEYFIDGEFVGAGKFYKEEYARKLYDAGLISEAKEYLLGYRLWKETKLGGNHTNPYKEAARVSHELIQTGGKAGHKARQIIRRKIIQTKKSFI